jgi:hypothetical protein
MPSTYTASQPAPGYAWIIIADDGHQVITLPHSMPELVASAIAAAFTAEAARCPA